MKLSFLITNETKVRRRMDSPLIDIAELTGKVFDILDFEVREPDKKKGKHGCVCRSATRIWVMTGSRS